VGARPGQVTGVEVAIADFQHVGIVSVAVAGVILIGQAAGSGWGTRTRAGAGITI